MVARISVSPRTFAISTVALMSMALFACGSDPASQPTGTPTSPTPSPTVPVTTPTPYIDFHPVLGQEFVLPVGGVAILNGNGASARFVRVVSDNRCPLNVTCITGGAAVVEMAVRLSPSSPEETLRWAIGSDKTDPSMRTIAGLDVELLEVEPVPGDTGSNGTTQVRLVVTTSPNSPT